MQPGQVLRLQIGEGRYFPWDEQRLFCVATFNGETQQTSLSLDSPSCPAWNTQLEWSLTAQQLRRLESSGASHCKVVFAREDGRSVGWVVCDLRTAKLHAKHPKKLIWWAVAGPFKGKDAPEVQLYHTLVDQPAAPLQQRPASSNNMPAVAAPLLAYNAPHPTPAAAPGSLPAAGENSCLGGPPSLFPAQPANAADAQLLQQAGAMSQGIIADGSQRRFQFSVDLRQFQAGRRLPLNLASVVCQLSLPQEFAGLILQSNGRLPPRLAPLRTQPPVDIGRGCEAALSGGQASVRFTAGLMSLATLLARNPVMTVEVWHKEQLAEDSLLGRAHIPLSPLLQESWVDGRAGVFAMLPAAGHAGQERVQVGTLQLVMALEEIGPATAVEQPPSLATTPRCSRRPAQQQPSSLAATPQHAIPAQLNQHNHPQRQQAGVTISGTEAEETYRQLPGQPPAPSIPEAEIGQPQQEPTRKVAGGAAARLHTSSKVQHSQPPADGGSKLPPPGAIPNSIPAALAGSLAESSCEAQNSTQPPADAAPSAPVCCGQPQRDLAPPATGGIHLQSLEEALPAVLHPQQPCAADAQLGAQEEQGCGGGGADAGAEATSALQAIGPEIEVAWELELWKRQEEERWRAELKQREAERMAMLEAEWWRREQEREAEQAAMRHECSAMQARAQQVLTAAEDREKKVLAAEEAVGRRRRELEREHVARVGDAEAAVRRLQMEFEHQLEMERLRTQQLQQQKAAAEERAATTEMQATAAERALQECKQQHISSAAGALERELGQVRAALMEARQQAARAGEAKRKYKEQVIRLAQEISTLQRHLAEVVGLRREQLDAEMVRMAAQEAALAGRREAGELGALRQQLRDLQDGGPGVGGKDAPTQPAPLLLAAGADSEEVQRLLQEREGLLSSGAYDREDPVIQQLDSRIRECATGAAATSVA